MSISLKHAGSPAAHSTIQVDVDDREKAILCPVCNDWFLRGPEPSIRTQEQECEILWAVAEQLQARGFVTVMGGGGAIVPWLEIQLVDGRVATMGLCNDTWGGEKYLNQAALEACEDQDVYDLGLPTWVTDPAQVAEAFMLTTGGVQKPSEEPNAKV